MTNQRHVPRRWVRPDAIEEALRPSGQSRAGPAEGSTPGSASGAHAPASASTPAAAASNANAASSAALLATPSTVPAPILPPATIGILGGGQLGRMLGLAARELGYGVVVLDPDAHCPAAAIADRVEVGGYDDVTAATRLARSADVVTYELEHVALAVVDAVAAVGRPVRPGRLALKVTQDRLEERAFLEGIGVPVAPHRIVTDQASLATAAYQLDLPLRLKAATGGYDGRSQVRIAAVGELGNAIDLLGRPAGERLLLEKELPFECELSVVVARAGDGTVAAFPVGRNLHDRGILAESVAPAPIRDGVAARAQDLAIRIAEALGVVGVMTVELFLLPDGSLVVNELAPRVHNSGHWTIEAAVTSQFEQHIRAICGLPLGSAELRGAAATVNLLGTGRRRAARLAGIPAALATPDVHLHVYDKREVFDRRKMGHVTALGRTVEEALSRARAGRAALTWTGDD